MSDDDRRLREALREEAARHEPDRARMLDSLEARFGPFEALPARDDRPSRVRQGGGHRGRAAGRRRASRWRLAALPAAAMVAAAGLAGGWWLSGSGQDSGRTAAAVPATSVRPETGGTTAEGGREPDPRSTARSAQEEATPAPSPRATQEQATPARVRARAVLDPNSNPYWAQNNLVLTFGERVRGLNVTVRVKRGEGVAAAGMWLSLPNDDFTARVDEEAGSLVYRWVLKPGRVVVPGTYTFAAQYTRGQADAGGSDDTYVVQLPDGRLSGKYQ